MKTQLKQTLCMLFGVFATATSSLKAQDKDKDKDIVQTVAEAGNFSMLSNALRVSGLDKTLRDSKSSFTVFAPTDKAFMQLPKRTLESLFEPGNIEQLKSLLTYHVVSGKLNGGKVVSLKEAQTLQGEKVKIKFRKAALYLDRSRVSATDIQASNGVIHIVDSLLIPKNVKLPRVYFSSKEQASKTILVTVIAANKQLSKINDPEALRALYLMNRSAAMAVLEIRPKVLSQKDLNELENTLNQSEGTYLYLKRNGSDIKMMTISKQLENILKKLDKWTLKAERRYGC